MQGRDAMHGKDYERSFHAVCVMTHYTYMVGGALLQEELIERVQRSLKETHARYELSDTIALLPYRVMIEGDDAVYPVGIHVWELDARFKSRASSMRMLHAYAALGAGIVVMPDTRKLYGQLIAHAPNASSLLASRTVQVHQEPWGNYTRLLQFQLEPEDPYRSRMPKRIIQNVRSGAYVSIEEDSLETFLDAEEEGSDHP